MSFLLGYAGVVVGSYLTMTLICVIRNYLDY